MKRLSFAFLSALALAGAASAAPDAFDARVADVGLLQAKQVQTDVGITTAQRTKLNAAADAHKGRLQAYEKQLKALGQSQPDRNRLVGFFKTLKDDVFAVMTPAQLKRLREITLQRLGVVALTDPEVAKRVGITTAQVAKLKSTFTAGQQKFTALQQSTAQPILAPYQNKKPKDQAQAAAWQKDVQAKLQAASTRVKPRLMAIGKQTDADMLGVLNTKQRSAWNALKGRPFKA